MISPDMLSQIAQHAAQGALDESLLGTLKQTWPDLRFTMCSDDDMPARMKPALSENAFNLYLIGGSEHCLSLTDDPERAIGVVVAQVDEE